MRNSFQEVPFYKKENRRLIPLIMGILMGILMILIFVCSSIKTQFSILDRSSQRFLIELPCSEKKHESFIQHLRTYPFVKKVTLLDQDHVYNLLSSWVQSPELLSDLPMPTFIDVYLNDKVNPDLERLRLELQKIEKDVHIHASTRWDKTLFDLSTTIQGGTYAFMFGIFVVMVVLISLITRSSLSSHQYLLDTLRLLGIRHSDLALKFQGQSLVISFLGILIGMSFSFPFVYFFSTHLSLLHFNMTPKSILWMILWPVIASIFCSFISRFTVVRYLARLEHQ